MVPGLAPRSSSSVVTAAPSSPCDGQGSRPGLPRELWSGVLGVLEWNAPGLQSIPLPARPSPRPDPHTLKSNRVTEVVIVVVIAAC